MIDIQILGQQYQVPESLTILRAFEWAGFQLVRGVGCRGGFCGACGTIYRLAEDHRLYYAMACQASVKPGMYLSQIPFFPAQHPAYHLERLSDNGDTLLEMYPELTRCYGCNTCTKSCPQTLEVLDYISAALRGDLAAVAELSFDCIQCGLCVARCPADLVPPNVALLARRLYGKYVAPPARHLQERVAQIRSGAYQDQVAALKMLPLDELKQQYESRTFEE